MNIEDLSTESIEAYLAKRKSGAREGERPVLICTAHRGVFFGYATDTSGPTVKLRHSRCCIYWAKSVGGFQGLAATGPDAECRIGAVADAEYRDVTYVGEVTPAAERAWLDAPCHK